MTHTSRRRFAQTLVVAGAALPILAQAAPDCLPYGQQLDDDERKRVAATRKDFDGLVTRLRDFKLTNSDEPDFTFSALADRW